MNEPFVTVVEWDNDGHPSPYSDMQRALTEGMLKFYDEGGFSFTSVTIESMDRDHNRLGHCKFKIRVDT